MRRLLLAISFALIAGCSQGPGYQVQTLPSGKAVKVVGVTKMFLRKGDAALILKYQTDLPINDVPALAKEADEIWPSFRTDVENAGLSSAGITATTAPTGLILKESKAYTFAYIKGVDGQWSRAK